MSVQPCKETSSGFEPLSPIAECPVIPSRDFFTFTTLCGVELGVSNKACGFFNIKVSCKLDALHTHKKKLSKVINDPDQAAMCDELAARTGWPQIADSIRCQPYGKQYTIQLREGQVVNGKWTVFI